MNGKGSGERILDLVSDRIIAMTSGRAVVFTLCLFLVLGYLVNARPFGIAELKVLTGGTGILDMEVLYTPDQAYGLLFAQGAAGRSFYLTHIVPLDLFLPICYALAFSLLITWLLRRWLPAGNPWHRLNVVPLIGGLCDYLENLGVISMLLAWPAQLPDIARFTMGAGLLKFSFSALTFVILLGAIFGWIITKIRTGSGPGSADTRNREVS